MTDEQKAKQREYNKRYYEKHKGELKENRDDKEKKARIKEYNKKYYEEHKKELNEKRADYFKEYNEQNKEAIKEKRADYFKEYRKKYYTEHKDYFKEYKQTEKYKEQQKEYEKQNKDHIAKNRKKWKQEHHDEILEQRKEWDKAYRETHKEEIKQYKEEHKEQINKTKREYHKKKVATDPRYKIEKQIRGVIFSSFSRKGYKKNSHTYEIVGTDYDTFYKHLLQTFKDNYGYEWDEKEKVHIDHIIPLATATNEKEILELCNYKNLQLLKEKDNLAKKDKLDFKLDEKE